MGGDTNFIYTTEPLNKNIIPSSVTRGEHWKNNHAFTSKFLESLLQNYKLVVYIQKFAVILTKRSKWDFLWVFSHHAPLGLRQTGREACLVYWTISCDSSATSGNGISPTHPETRD